VLIEAKSVHLGIPWCNPAFGTGYAGGIGRRHYQEGIATKEKLRKSGNQIVDIWRMPARFVN
jgi:hypothetical protein